MFNCRNLNNVQNMMMNKQKDTQSNETATDFHGAALIDDDGNETPITEDMVQEACTNIVDDSKSTENGTGSAH